MAIEYMTYIWKNEQDITGSRLLLMLAYADYADGEGKSWAEAAQLAQRIRGSEGNVKTLKADLLKAHKIIRIPRYKTKGQQTSDYVVIVAKGLNCTSYEELCQKYAVAPLDYVPLLKEQRGGNNPAGKNKGGLNSSGQQGGLEFKRAGGLNSSGLGGLNSSHDPLVDPSRDPSDSAAAKANGKQPAKSSRSKNAHLKAIPQDIKDAVFELISLGSFGFHYKSLPDESRGYANGILADLFRQCPTLTAPDLKAGYQAIARAMPQVVADPTLRVKDAKKILHWVGIAKHGGAGGQLEQSEDWHWYHAAYALLTGKSESEYPALVAQEPETILGNLRLMCASRADRQRLIDAGFEHHLQELHS